MSALTRPDQPVRINGAGAPAPAPRRELPPPATEGSALASAVLGLSLAVLTLAGLAGFNRVFVDAAWVGPVVVTALIVQVLATALRFVRIPPIVAMAGGLSGVAIIGVASTLGFGAFASFPTGTWRIVAETVQQAHAALTIAVPPVPTQRGFDLLAAWGAGVVALLGDWGTFRLRSPVQGAAPGLALFVLCCVLGGPAHRTADLAGWLAAALIYLLAHQVATGGSGAVPFAARRPRSLRRMVMVGAAMAAASLAVGMAITPALATRDGRGVLGWRDSSGSGTRVVESPIVDLRTRIVKERNVPVFTVRSPAPSYWRLTSLNTFNGSLWTSTNSYQSANGKLPGVASRPAGIRTVVEEFRIQDLDSIWLPAAFDPEAVTGVGKVTYDPTSGSLLTGHATSNDLVYQVTSYERLASLSAAKLAEAGALPADRTIRRYLQLPAQIPASVVRLARAITAGKTTEYAKALALQNYLLGPLFTYSTNPPTDGYSTSSLATFLLDTHTGYCQQFAGAYAVMARIVGIPTRLAVGFATGTQDANGVYHVTDADAHTWPEVYFPGYGWVPFEPTKGTFAIPEGDAYTGSKLGDVPARPSPVAGSNTTSSTAVGAAVGNPESVANRDVSAGRAGRSGHHADLGRSLGLAAGGAGAILILWPTLNVTARRLRWTSRRRRLLRRGRRGALLAAWQETSERLAWRGVPRRLDETSAEYAWRAGTELASDLPPRTALYRTALHRRILDRTALHRTAPGPVALDRPALERLADAVTRARFSDRQPPEDSTADALASAGALAKTLWEGAPLRLRLQWWLDPLPAWSAREAGAS
jgi:transglutaminase-like putative cysteine protease